MATFVDQLKAEISRIAKKEVRAETKQLKKASAQYRSDIAALKRHIASLETSLKRLSKNQPKPALEVKASATGLRFRAGGFATLRKKFAMSAKQMGKLLGVSAQSVYHWEAGKSRPRASQLPAIAAARTLTKKEAWAKIS